MTPPNDMPADTELREAILDILVARSGDKEYAKLFERHNVEPLMQLIKARDADNEILIREEYWNLEFALDEAYDNGALKPDLEDAWIEFNKRKSTPTDQKENE